MIIHNGAQPHEGANLNGHGTRTTFALPYQIVRSIHYLRAYNLERNKLIWRIAKRFVVHLAYTRRVLRLYTL